MAKPAPDSEILIVRVRAGILLGSGTASVIVCLWRHYELFLPLWIVVGYALQALVSYGQPFGDDMKLGNLPEDVCQWPMEVRQALDRAEATLENPWNGAGRTRHRTRKAISILRKALKKATGESAQFLVGEIEDLERLLTMLH